MWKNVSSFFILAHLYRTKLIRLIKKKYFNFKVKNSDREVVKIVPVEFVEKPVIVVEIRNARKNLDGQRQLMEQKEKHLFLGCLLFFHQI